MLCHSVEDDSINTSEVAILAIRGYLSHERTGYPEEDMEPFGIVYQKIAIFSIQKNSQFTKTIFMGNGEASLNNYIATEMEKKSSLKSFIKMRW